MRARFEKVPSDPAQSFFSEERILGAFDAPWHFHPEVELTCILESRGRRFVGDSVAPFREDDLVLLGPNLPHFWSNEVAPQAKCQAHSIVVQFLPDFLGREIWGTKEFAPLRSLIARASRGLAFDADVSREVAPRLRRISGLQGLPALLELLGVLQALSEVSYPKYLASKAYEPDLNRHSEARLARVYAFLMEHFRDELTLGQIARVACMTPPAFSRYFKRSSGRNISEFLVELRIEYAASLLRETHARIGDIALESGFTTLSSFNRRFQDRMKRSPRDYRKLHAVSPESTTSHRFS